MTPPIPVFAGRVDARGHLTLEQQPRFLRWLQRLKDTRVDLIVRKHQSKRSLDQNRLCWRLNTLIAEHLGYERNEVEQVHYALLALHYGTDDRLGVSVPIKTSSQMTTAEMSAYLDWVVRWAASEQGLVLPMPDDLDLDAYDEGAA